MKSNTYNIKIMRVKFAWEALVLIHMRIQVLKIFIRFILVEWQLAAVYKECDGRDLDRGRQASVDACASACKKHSTMFTFEEHNQGYCRCQLSAKVDGTCKERDSHGKKLYRYVKGQCRYHLLLYITMHYQDTI